MSDSSRNFDIAEPAVLAATEELGGVLEEHKPSMGRVLLGYAIVAVMIVGGVGGAVWMTPPQGRQWVRWLPLLALPLAIGVIFYLRYLSGFRIYVCQQGLVYANRAYAMAFAWQRVVRVHQHVSKSNLPARGVLGRVPVGTLSTYRIYRDDEEELLFNRETVSDARRLAEYVAEQAAAHEIEWSIIEDE